jgi:protoporphyrinogen oxidase
MKTEHVHTLILGAGPSGLAAGYTLAKGGVKPVVLERDKVSGGLMRSVRHREFILDIGRKELYNRLEKVDQFWGQLLGGDYRTYPHRGGILFGNNIIDMSPAYRGFRRGMPWSMFLGCCSDFLVARAGLNRQKPRNLEEYWYGQRGRRLTQIANQGFQEKLAGRKWSEVSLPNTMNGHGTSFLGTVKQAMVRAFSSKETNTFKGLWRHPAKGTGQICDSLEKGIVAAGGQVLHEAQVLEMSSGEGKIKSVTARIGEETVVFLPKHVVSSAPAEYMVQLLLPKQSESGTGTKPGPSGTKRTVILVYLFLNEEPRFEHFWLQVTCPKTRIGRIANYAALNADMVPRGKTSLCCEIYCFGEDPLLKTTTEELAKLALDDCARAGLVTREKCFDTLVLKFPGADASQNRHNWLNKGRVRLIAELRQFENLYSVNRTDLDIATLAGIEAAEAILSGNRQQFDEHLDPTTIGIRSVGKPLEFRNPPGVEI